MKAKETENNNRFWHAFRKKAGPIKEESDDEVIDTDLEDNVGVEDLG